jgi:hypothetical protein
LNVLVFYLEYTLEGVVATRENIIDKGAILPVVFIPTISVFVICICFEMKKELRRALSHPPASTPIFG